MINQRLFDHYGIDTKKNLQIPQSCARPFDTVLIDRKGSCYACECASWLPQSIGNLQIQEFRDIVGSAMHKELQDSISDRSYKYCNQAQCSYLKSGRFYEATEQNIKHLRLAIDDSCNLRCPSCRKGLIFHKEGSAYNLGIRLADKINDWLYNYEHPIQVHIGSDGDPFASHVYRHFMEQTPQRDNFKYSILSNGLMFREFYNTVPHVINNLQELGVSIDGASKETYEKLRLGGRWEKILEGLECMTELKKKYNFRFSLHMVVQQENWHEVESMLELGRTYNVDRIYFNKIEDWNTGIDFESQTFTELEEFKKSIRRVSTDPIVWNNVVTLT
jgi:sulfatase maturation enzyme AslB (radical SAM superfamily)